ncbi:MAG: nitronate monooxygenase [Candidatus Krumholzibacteriales bacterium]
MSFSSHPALRIDDIELKIPIIQGGMGVGISLSRLASAIANQGGVGVIATAGIGYLEPDFMTDLKSATRRALKKEIVKAREMTDGVVGVNVMLALTDYKSLITTAVDSGIDIVFLSAGLPFRLPGELNVEYMNDSGAKFVPIVSSARAAKLLLTKWNKMDYPPDAIVIEGPLAGGHLGFSRSQLDDREFTLEKIFRETREFVDSFEQKHGRKVPLIVAGGIFSGGDIYKFLEMGADGVQMATRFVGTFECDADDNFKQRYIECRMEDLTIIDSPVGLPGRAINNKFIRQIRDGIMKPYECPWQCLKTCDVTNAPYCIAKALTEAKYGNFEDGFAFAGSNAYKIKKIVHVKELIESLDREYNRAAESVSMKEGEVQGNSLARDM